jgi:hypothetical protein
MHTYPAHEMAKADHPLAHSLTLSLILALPLSSSSLSLSLHSLTLKQGKEEKGEVLKLGCSKIWPWRPPRSPHPQEVGVGRGRSPLTLP